MQRNVKKSPISEKKIVLRRKANTFGKFGSCPFPSTRRVPLYSKHYEGLFMTKQIRRIPFSGSQTLGRGFNTLSGEFVGKALGIKAIEKATPGQEVTFNVEICQTQESFMKSLDLSVEVSGRYGLFSGEGKFGLSEKASYNAASTFVVASCRVRNAFEMVEQVELLPDAQRLLEEPEKFKTAFGSSFVRGIQTGGEFYVVMQITSTDQSQQSEISAELHASYQGLVASAGLEAKLKVAQESKSSKTSISTLMYQRAGQDEQMSLVNNPAEVIQRLKDFPKIARTFPCGYECEVADYNTLALSVVNQEEVADREMALTDCARLRLKYLKRRNDYEFARENRVFFEGLESDAILSDAAEKYTRAVSLVQLHAQKIAARNIPPTVFDLKQVAPDLTLPFLELRRVNVASDIPMPDLIGSSIDFAKTELTRLGLETDVSSATAVEPDSRERTNIVTAQEPPGGTLVQPKSRVRLSYNYVASSRFSWVKDADRTLIELRKTQHIIDSSIVKAR
jgi:hypothetical protein